MSKPSGNRVLHFMGFGGKRAEDEPPKDGETNDATTEANDEEEEDDEEEEGSEEERREARTRNALRAAGHRRGVAAERDRIASAMNGIPPEKAELALHLALNSDMSADQIRAATAKGASASRASAFAAAMTQHRPPIGAGGESTPQKETAASRMQGMLRRQGIVK